MRPPLAVEDIISRFREMGQSLSSEWKEQLSSWAETFQCEANHPLWRDRHAEAPNMLWHLSLKVLLRGHPVLFNLCCWPWYVSKDPESTVSAPLNGLLTSLHRLFVEPGWWTIAKQKPERLNWSATGNGNIMAYRWLSISNLSVRVLHPLVIFVSSTRVYDLTANGLA